MEKSENFGFYLPSRDIDDIVDINQISDNFRVIDKELNEIDNISATVEKIDNKSIITITDKNGTVHTTEILDGQNGKDADMSLVANALKGNASGNVVALKDVSPLPHNVNIQLKNEDGSPYIPDSETIIDTVKVGIDESDSYNWADVAPDNIFRFSLSNGGVKNLKIKGLIQKIAIAPIIDGQIEVGENAEVFWINYLGDDRVWHFNAEFSIVDGVLNFEFSIDHDSDVENGVMESWGSSYETRLGANQKITGIAIKTNEPDDSWVSLSVESLVNKDVSVKVCGKNLFDKSKSIIDGIKNETAVAISSTVVMENDALIQNLKPNVKYTLSYEVECLSVPENATCIETAVGLLLRNRGISGNIANPYYRQLKVGDVINHSVSFTLTEERYENGKFEMLGYCNNYTDKTSGAYVKPSMIIRNIQIEEGATATDYEPYIEPTTYTADENGRLTIPSMYPSMTIFADSDATMSVEYNRDINKAEFGGTADLNNYYTKNEIDGLVGDIETLLGGI